MFITYLLRVAAASLLFTASLPFSMAQLVEPPEQSEQLREAVERLAELRASAGATSSEPLLDSTVAVYYVSGGLDTQFMQRDKMLAYDSVSRFYDLRGESVRYVDGQRDVDAGGRYAAYTRPLANGYARINYGYDRVAETWFRTSRYVYEGLGAGLHRRYWVRYGADGSVTVDLLNTRLQQTYPEVDTTVTEEYVITDTTATELPDRYETRRRSFDSTYATTRVWLRAEARAQDGLPYPPLEGRNFRRDTLDAEGRVISTVGVRSPITFNGVPTHTPYAYLTAYSSGPTGDTTVTLHPTTGDTLSAFVERYDAATGTRTVEGYAGGGIRAANRSTEHKFRSTRADGALTYVAWRQFAPDGSLSFAADEYRWYRDASPTRQLRSTPPACTTQVLGGELVAVGTPAVAGEAVTLYDAAGRAVASAQAEPGAPARLTLPAAGVYVVVGARSGCRAKVAVAR